MLLKVNVLRCEETFICLNKNKKFADKAGFFFLIYRNDAFTHLFLIEAPVEDLDILLLCTCFCFQWGASGWQWFARKRDTKPFLCVREQ